MIRASEKTIFEKNWSESPIVLSGRLDCRGVVPHKVSPLLKYSFQFKPLAGASDRLSTETTGSEIR